MKKPILYVICSFFSICSSFGQNYPGGVNKPIYWFHQNQETKFSGDFNFNPYTTISENRSIFESFKDFDQFTFFIVYKQRNNGTIAEIKNTNGLIEIGNSYVKANREIEFENSRVKTHFICFIGDIAKHELRQGIGKTQLKIGGDDNAFEGEIAEILLYPKGLSKVQRQKIESYLSFKYGISLPIKSDYLDSDGNIIYGPAEAGEFINDITGIGKDIKGEFQQCQSKNIEDKLNLTISFNCEKLQNNKTDQKNSSKNYLIWGHNGKKTSYVKDGNSERLERKWQVKNIGDEIVTQEFTLMFDTTGLLDKKGNFVYLLSINNEQNYSLTVDDNKFVARNVRFGDNDSSYDQFTIYRTTPKLFFEFDGNCNGEFLDGIVNYPTELSAERLVLTNLDNNQVLEFSLGLNKDIIREIPLGRYNAALKSRNTLLFNQNLELTKEQCISESNVIINPNPSIIGDDLEIVLSAQTDGMLSIYDSNGKLVNSKSIQRGINNLSTKEMIQGYYTCIVQVANKRYSKKLILISK